jgi:hypothetical protein
MPSSMESILARKSSQLLQRALSIIELKEGEWNAALREKVGLTDALLAREAAAGNWMAKMAMERMDASNITASLFQEAKDRWDTGSRVYTALLGMADDALLAAMVAEGEARCGTEMLNVCRAIPNGEALPDEAQISADESSSDSEEEAAAGCEGGSSKRKRAEPGGPSDLTPYKAQLDQVFRSAAAQGKAVQLAKTRLEDLRGMIDAMDLAHKALIESMNQLPVYLDF